MAPSMRKLTIHVLLAAAVEMTIRTTHVAAMKASALPKWDNPQRLCCQACEWDLKICADGTWVYPDPEKDCVFPDCWVAVQTPTPAPEYEVI